MVFCLKETWKCISCLHYLYIEDWNDLNGIFDHSNDVLAVFGAHLQAYLCSISIIPPCKFTFYLSVYYLELNCNFFWIQQENYDISFTCREIDSWEKKPQQNIGMNSAIQISPEERAYPIRTFHIFGGIQIGLGILSGVLSFAGIVLDGVNINNDCYDNHVVDSNYNYKRCSAYSDASFMLAVDISCLISSGWVSNISIYSENC